MNIPSKEFEVFENWYEVQGYSKEENMQVKYILPTLEEAQEQVKGRSHQLHGQLHGMYIAKVYKKVHIK